jgi:hypothetical protein
MYYQTIVRNIHPNSQSHWRIPIQLLLVLAITCFTSPRHAQGADGNLGNDNTAEGLFALNAIATNSANTGTDNTAIGTEALAADTSGSFNTASGSNALALNSTGGHNTATGFDALFNNNGDDNTATGFKALLHNTSGSRNTATGNFALSTNSMGDGNTATGYLALSNNTIGSSNTADGLQALASNMAGDNNTALGFNALVENSAGNGNVAAGVDALGTNDTGSSNTSVGFNALLRNTSGSFNIAVGNNAGINLTTGNNNIDIGAAGAAGESGKIRIGKQGTQNGTFIAGIAGTPVTGSTVVVTATGKLGVATSSARYKDDIKPMDKASEDILALKPVTFCYKKDLDPDHIPQFGLIAEEVEKVNPDLVVRDEDGRVNTVRYEAVNAMLLNEFLKEHHKVEELEKQIKALTAGLQKVTARVDAASSGSHVVGDN